MEQICFIEKLMAMCYKYEIKEKSSCWLCAYVSFLKVLASDNDPDQHVPSTSIFICYSRPIEVVIVLPCISHVW